MGTNKMRDDLPTMVEQAITGHPGYPEFTAWCESQRIHPAQIYFLIWQASRESVVVDLPPRGALAASDSPWEVFDACREAVEAQGLKVEVKP